MSDQSEGHAANVRRGWALHAAGDERGAEDAFRTADELGSADGTFALGVLLRGRGDDAGALLAYRRAEERGDPRASCNLAVILEEQGDIEGAKTAYRRADALGFAGGAYGLGQLLYSEGDVNGAEAAMRRSDELGDEDATFNLGAILRDRGDLAEAEAVFARAIERGNEDAPMALSRMLTDRGDLVSAERVLREADDRGEAMGAFELGVMLYRRSDLHGALAALQRAADRGYDGAAEIADQLAEELSEAPAPVESPVPTTPRPSETWTALRDRLAAIGVEALSDTALVKTIPRGDTGRSQRVWLSYEVILPDFEVVRIHSPFARIGAVDLSEIVRHVGQLLAGSLGYLNAADEAGDPSNGILTVGISLPLELLDPGNTADIASVMTHVAIISAAADQLEERFGAPGDFY